MSLAGGRVVAVSGGVGGAKLALGLSRVLATEQLLVCANTGDDFTHLGLRICPDLDTIMYTLSGLSNPELGWGLAGESWQFMDQLAALNGECWFRLGDRDLATHVMRSHLLNAGLSLSSVTQQLCRALGIETRIVPMTDQVVATRVRSDAGELAFQEYFVQRQCEPVVRGLEFQGVELAEVQPEVLAGLVDPDLEAVILCPSNPFVSIAPVLAVPGMRAALQACPAPVIAVSPIVGGKALKGPAAKMMQELAMPASAEAVAVYYGDLLDGFVIDNVDRSQVGAIEALGMRPLVTRTVMQSTSDKEQLARAVLAFARDLRR